ncbi:LLM class flavin-dependent oxidoreductase [Nesterenkonia salmonea]|uniref:LLM class flavin-dependent oxidoreductase n=1 Tax=Nesterenkonia salmonea TaxID=1804987 RepID=A0A5R9BAN0_9MICC|nr:LLM class flavin-dependent oxidoreductase [Nesterenkonia salmonea]TLP94874.1 LLM class flavin-dependent oxidoreductase [Nesterenkonia salmonea]
MAPRIGFFTRLLENDTAANRYRFALEQMRHAEACGFTTAWIAQHHFDADEGGLPSPWPMLGAAAATTDSIRLGTAVVTLPHESALRTAEDASVVDQLSGGRLELGVAPGASPETLAAFGYGGENPRELFAAKFDVLRSALRGEPIDDTGLTLQPLSEGLESRIWQATFSSNGAARAGSAGDGLMLSRVQPGSPEISINEAQNPIVDTYLESLPESDAARILTSRTLVVIDEENRESVTAAARPRLEELAARTYKISGESLTDQELFRLTNSYFGTPEQVLEQLSGDEIIARSTDVSFQVHSIDPGHELTLRSLELIATEVAPQLGWALSDKVLQKV